jgi:hypothetical protein
LQAERFNIKVAVAAEKERSFVMATYIEELKDVIRRLHGVESEHVESVRVKETFRGRTVWEGIVEVFDLVGHPNAFRVYAWAHDTDDPEHPRRHVTVLHLHPSGESQQSSSFRLDSRHTEGRCSCLRISN